MLAEAPPPTAPDMFMTAVILLAGFVVICFFAYIIVQLVRDWTFPESTMPDPVNPTTPNADVPSAPGQPDAPRGPTPLARPTPASDQGSISLYANLYVNTTTGELELGARNYRSPDLAMERMRTHRIRDGLVYAGTIPVTATLTEAQRAQAQAAATAAAEARARRDAEASADDEDDEDEDDHDGPTTGPQDGLSLRGPDEG